MNKAHSAINWENYPSDASPLNEANLNKMDRSIGTIDDRVIELDTIKATKTEVATLVADVTFEESTGIITVTRKNGSVFTIDTQLEKIAVNFTYDPTTEQIILTLIDGTKQYIDLSALITQYEFMDTDTVAFIIGTDGKVSAIVKEGSIEEKHLEPNYLAKIKVEVSKAQASQQAAAASEKNTKESENAAKASETAAAASETNAKSSETAAAASETAAKTSEGNAKKSETAAATSETNAKASEEAAAESEGNARDFEQSCRLRAEEAENSATTAGMYKDDAEVYSTKAQSYAVGGTGSREGEDADNAKYYYEQVKDVSEGIKGGLQPRGTVAFADLPQLDDAVVGWMFNISDEFTTTDDFKEGAGNVIPAGSNIYKTSDEKWDVLAGTPVTGIKGANETSYRRGNVNLTAENIGAVATDGEVTENTVDYDSADVEDGNASLSWLSIPAFTKANVNKVGAMFTNVARLFRNVRYLYKMLGTTDISKIGNGTCTGAISSLNSSLAKCLSVDGQHATYNPISDLNIFYNGIGLFTNPTLNMPGDGWFLVISGGVGGTTCQRAVSLFGGSTFHRYCASSNWSSWAVDNYLPLSGGTITGNVSTNGGATFATDGNVYLNSNGYKDWLTNILNGKISTSASCNKNWNWFGIGGQPTWLWGGEDGTNMYVYNPSNFTVYRCTGGINKGGNGVGISGEATTFRTYNNAGSPVDNVMTLGSSGGRWKQLYAATTTISTSDRNMKDNIRELTDIHKEFFKKLVPVSFTFKDGESGRTHVGFIAQDVEQAMSECGLTDLDFAGLCKDIKVEAYLNEESGEYEEKPLLDNNGNVQYIYSLRYEEFIAIIAYVLQDVTDQVEELRRAVAEIRDLVQNK